jgi:hypothetical protein
MSTLSASLLVLGILIGLGGPTLWWIFFRMDEASPTAIDPGEELPTAALAPEALARIEETLGLTLPTAYRNFLATARTRDIDGQSVFGDADLIISSTQEYREGFGGNPRWPRSWVYVGDEADACPYVVDTITGEVIRTDHGNPDRKPLERFASFKEFADKFD